MSHPPGRRAEVAVRAADGDRERAVAELQGHFVAGRLGADDLAARVERAYAARTLGDLDAVLRGLPEAPRRLPVRTHLVAYVLFSAILVVVWAATVERNPGPEDAGAGRYWPFWIMAVWGLVLALHATGLLGRVADEFRTPRRRLPPGGRG